MLRHALRADFPAVIETWTDAFSADPYLRWIQPDDALWPAFAADWFAFILQLAFERGHTYVTDPVDAAVAWIPPDLSLVGPDDLARGVAILVSHAGDQRGDAAAQTIVAARAHALDEPHWTLQYIGVRSGRRSCGLGASIVAPGLDVCDRDGLPCSLVSSNPTNLPFYARLGFEVVAEAWSPDQAVCLRPMVRPST